MKQISATFIFSEQYRATNWQLQDASVKLDINYPQKTYAITPHGGSQDFRFINTNKDYLMWLAVLKAIEKAIEFANTEIGVTPKAEVKG